MNAYKILMIILVIGTNSCSFFGNKKESCCPRLQHDYVEVPASFPELVQQAYLFRNDERFPDLCRLLNDSILSCEKSLLWASSKIDTVNRNISWRFIPFNPYMLGRARDRFLLDVCITTENKIWINAIEMDISEIREQAIEYIFCPDEEDKNMVVKKVYIKSVGEIESSQVTVSMHRNNGSSVTEWKLFFDCMYELMLVFEYEMNKKSIDIWGVSYDCLDCDKKEMLLKVIDYNIIIDFFNSMVSYCNPPLPPPSPSRKP